MYLEVYESYFWFNSTLCLWEILQKKHVGKEQGIEALDNCDPEPEHRLLYQVLSIEGLEVVGWEVHDMFFFISCFFTKTNT